MHALQLRSPRARHARPSRPRARGRRAAKVRGPPATPTVTTVPHRFKQAKTIKNNDIYNTSKEKERQYLLDANTGGQQTRGTDVSALVCGFLSVSRRGESPEPRHAPRPPRLVTLQRARAHAHARQLRHVVPHGARSRRRRAATAAAYSVQRIFHNGPQFRNLKRGRSLSGGVWHGELTRLVANARANLHRRQGAEFILRGGPATRGPL